MHGELNNSTAELVQIWWWLYAIGLIGVVLTKVADVWSTWLKLQGAGDETNPFAAGLMHRWGFRTGIMIVSLIYVLILAVSTWAFAASLEFFVELAHSGWIGATLAWSAQCLVFAYLLLVSVVQAAVAHHNWTGRSNSITRRVLSFHSRWARRFRSTIA